MPATPLTVHNAEIRTATVEIKTLTVSGKQVTLAVFRQLRQSRIVTDEGTLNGQPWGIVNYHPDKCGDDWHHLHVVWQRGTELRRDKVSKPSWFRYSSKAADRLIQGAYCAYGHKAPPWAETAYRSAGYEYKFTVNGLECAANSPMHCPGMARTTTSGDHVPQPDCLAAADPEALKAPLAAEVAAELARRQRHSDRWEEIRSLPQLFIAV